MFKDNGTICITYCQEISKCWKRNAEAKAYLPLGLYVHPLNETVKCYPRIHVNILGNGRLKLS